MICTSSPSASQLIAHSSALLLWQQCWQKFTISGGFDSLQQQDLETPSSKNSNCSTIICTQGATMQQTKICHSILDTKPSIRWLVRTHKTHSVSRKMHANIRTQKHTQGQHATCTHCVTDPSNASILHMCMHECVLRGDEEAVSAHVHWHELVHQSWVWRCERVCGPASRRIP